MTLLRSFPRSYTPHCSVKRHSFELCLLVPMLYLYLFCAPVSKVWPKVSEKTKRTCKGIALSVKLDVIKCFNYGVWNKDLLCALKLWALKLWASTICTILQVRGRYSELYWWCMKTSKLLKPPCFFRGLGWKLWRLGDSQYAGGLTWGKYSPAAEHYFLLLELVVQGAFTPWRTCGP